ncbi:MAG: Gfo/Idh/MocA family oxidoreductase [Chloroflexi bacterium]|nr:Gfo/Idh/MocA family oxidoreductase [Chloroflexota bacterium]MCC6896605.1 Gfo/Idh/MocA family oxidoreductase [Anaerolineae bacterium]
MSKLRVGVIGCGAIGQVAHIPYLNRYDDKFELVALADVHQPTLDAVGDHYHVAGRHTDWRELVARPDVDAVVICHNGSHRDTTIGALQAGKHVFVEKPLAWNLREAKEVAAVAGASDRILQMGYHKLHDPAFAVAKEHLQQMQEVGFGRITVLHPANELGLSPHRIRRGNGVYQEGHVDTGTWQHQVDVQLEGDAGGSLSALVDEALGTRKGNNALRLAYGQLNGSIIHQIYTLYGFLGAPSHVVNTNVWRDGLSIHVLIAYANDLRVSLDWHFLQDLKDYREEYAFFGNDARVMMQLPSPYFLNFPSPVIVQGHEGETAWEKRIVVNYEEAFANELLTFYDNVQAGRKPALCSIDDAVAHTEFIQQVIDKAEN